jgi:hypothetical protein
VTMRANAAAAQSARLIRKLLRIKASSAPRRSSIRRWARCWKGAQSHFDLKDHGFEGSRRARLRLLGHNEGDDARRLEVQGKKTREENQIKDDPKKTAAGAVRP